VIKEEFLDKLKDIVSRSNNEKDYIEYCMVEDVETLLDDYEEEKGREIERRKVRAIKKDIQIYC